MNGEGRKWQRVKTRSAALRVRVTPGMHERLFLEAERRGVTVSEVLRMAAERWITQGTAVEDERQQQEEEAKAA